jgi:hypothetical protein
MSQQACFFGGAEKIIACYDNSDRRGPHPHLECHSRCRRLRPIRERCEEIGPTAISNVGPDGPNCRSG